MNGIKNQLPDFFEIGREAKAILARHENRLTLMLAILVTLAMCGVYITFGSAYWLLLGVLATTTLTLFLASLLFAVLICLLTLLFALPLAVGLFWMAGKMAHGEEVTLAALFEPFGSRRAYVRALGLSWGAFWRFGLTAFTVYLTCTVSLSLFEGSLLAGIVCGVLVVAEVALGLLLITRNFTVLATVSARDISAKEARMLVRNGYGRRGGIVFFVGFLPWLLPGICTFGILLLWDTLPRMLITYFRYSDAINQMTIIQSEEYTNHE